MASDKKTRWEIDAVIAKRQLLARLKQLAKDFREAGDLGPACELEALVEEFSP